jgi:hypothetical protein
VAEHRQGEQERLMLSLDYFKHLTTISGVATVGLVAVYQEELLNREFIGIALVMFAISAIFAILGLYGVLLHHFPRRVRTYPRVNSSYTHMAQ